MNDTAHPGAPIVYTPRDWSGARVLIPGLLLLIISVPLLIAAIITGSPGGAAGVAAFMVLLLWFLSTLRRRATLTADELVVRGRFASVRVPLRTITAVHQQDERRLVVWVAASGLRPFRIYFLTGHPSFVGDVRARARACGAELDTDAIVAPAPPGTRLLFTSF